MGDEGVNVIEVFIGKLNQFGLFMRSWPRFLNLILEASLAIFAKYFQVWQQFGTSMLARICKHIHKYAHLLQYLNIHRNGLFHVSDFF